MATLPLLMTLNWALAEKASTHRLIDNNVLFIFLIGFSDFVAKVRRNTYYGKIP